MAISSAHAATGPATPGKRPLPAPIRALAGVVYVITLGLLAWVGVQLACRQVPPRDPALDGPLPPGTRLSAELLPPDYPLANNQKNLRDYIFTIAAGQTPLAEWDVHVLREFRPAGGAGQQPAAAEPGAETAMAADADSLEVLKYDADLVRLRVAGREWWGPKAPISEKVEKKAAAAGK